MRRNNELPDEPIEALTDYFGAYNNAKVGEIGNLAEQVEKLKIENKILAEEIEATEKLIDQKKIEKEQAEAARKLAEEEEAKKKGKKGAPGAQPGQPAKKK